MRRKWILILEWTPWLSYDLFETRVYGPFRSEAKARKWASQFQTPKITVFKIRKPD